MKKKISCILVVILVLTMILGGCGGSTNEAKPSQVPNETETASANETNEPKKAIKIGYAAKTLNNPYFTVLSNVLKEECEKRGYELTILNAQDVIDNEQKNIETFIAQGFDAIIANCIDPFSSAPQIAMARDAGIPVVGVDTVLDKSTRAITSCAAENANNGLLVGIEIAKYYGDEEINAILISGTKGDFDGYQRRTGMFAGIIMQRTGCTEKEAWEASEVFENDLIANGHAKNEAAKFYVHGQGWGNWTVDDAIKPTEDLLIAHSDKNINLIMCENDFMAHGAISVAQAANIEGIKFASAADGAKLTYEYIIDGIYIAVGENNPGKVGTLALDVVEQILNGADPESFDQVTRTPALCVTKDNVEEIYNPDSIF